MKSEREALDEIQTLEQLDPPRITFIRGDQVTPVRVKYAWRSHIQIGALNLSAGREGSGKTLFGAHLIAQASTGKLTGEWEGQIVESLVIGTEDSISQVWIPRLLAAGADVSKVHFEPNIEGEPLVLTSKVTFDELGKELGNIRFVYLDHLSAVVPDDARVNDYADMGRVLRRVSKWAETYNVALLGGWHLGKGPGSTQDKVIGSVAIRASLRSLLLLAPHPETGSVYIALDKSATADTNVPALVFDRIPEVVSAGDGEPIKTVRCGTICEADHPGTGREYVAHLIDMASLPPARDSEHSDPDAWLGSFLRAHPGSTRKYVFAHAEKDGFGERTIDRAAERLNVVRVKRGREVEWSLPDD